MNNIRQCKRCRKLFNYVASPYCSRCIDAIDQEYRTVRDYIYDNPHAGISEISEATEVEERTILQLLREGRLELDSASSALKCERCATNIQTGRYCDSCQMQLSNELKSVQQSFAGASDSPLSKRNKTNMTKPTKNTDKDSKDFNERMHSRKP